MITDSERGLTVEAVAAELKSLDLRHAEQRDDMTREQRALKTKLTEVHKEARDLMAKRQDEARAELVSVLLVLQREAGIMDSDEGKPLRGVQEDCKPTGSGEEKK